MSKLLNLHLWKEFGAVVCVEILDPREFCDRVQVALPPNSSFPSRHGRPQLGHRVEYYDEREAGNSRWAVPDKIATSKLRMYAWQDEFRLVFSDSDAFQFQNVALSLVTKDHRDARDPGDCHDRRIRAGRLRDIAHLHSEIRGGLP